MTVILALDAMGGDKSPDIVLEGANITIQTMRSDLFFNIYGHEKAIEPLLTKYPNLSNCIKIHHTEEVVTNDTKPSAAIRGMKQSSMRLAIQSVSEGISHAVVSAGNTGAYMALSKIILKTLDGIDRPAIAATIPTFNEPCIALDLGANIDCTSENLVQFAVMGDIMAQRILHKNNPRVGLLNVGSEELKGSATVQQASQILKTVNQLNYVGFIEGDDITSGKVDVVVTDGFTGNIALKTMEGTAHFIMGSLKKALSSSWRGKLAYGIGHSVFSTLKSHLDPRLYNGAAFIGLKQVAVKSHGGTDGFGFANAIRVAADLAQNVNSHTITQEIENKLKDY